MDAAAARPSAQQLTAWRSFLRAHARLMRLLEADLLARHGLALPAYDVLVQLVEAPGHQLRMTELADRVLLSRSGLTRLVDRLERDGLVCRAASPGDARGVLAVLTDTGYATLREASLTHLRGIHEHVVAPLTETDLRDLRRVMDRLADGSPEDDRAAVSAEG